MLDEHHGHPAGQVPDRVAELVHLVGAQTGRRLVEHEQVRLVDQRPGEGDALLHRVGQRAGVAAGDLAGIEVGQDRHGAIAQGALVPVAAGQAERRGKEACLGAAGRPGHDVLQYGHAGEQPHALQGAGDAQTSQLVRLEPLEPLAAPAQDALVGIDEPADDVEQGRLTGAVGADHPQHLTRLDEQRHGVQRRQAAEADRDAVHVEASRAAAGFVHGRPTCACRYRCRRPVRPALNHAAPVVAVPASSPCWRPVLCLPMTWLTHPSARQSQRRTAVAPSVTDGSRAYVRPTSANHDSAPEQCGCRLRRCPHRLPRRGPSGPGAPRPRRR